MKKKSFTFESKLKTYSALAAGVLATSTLSAQVVYTDIDPDETRTDSIYDLNLDGDGTVDFKFVAGSGTQPFVRGGIYNNNEILGSISAGKFLNAYALDFGRIIDENQTTWNGDKNVGTTSPFDGYATFCWGTSYGTWQGVSDKYVGLKFHIGSNVHYGWARLDATADGGTFTIKDYAYESTPGQAIYAGQTATSIKNNDIMKGINIYSFNKNVIIDFQESGVENGTVNIFNNIGQEVYSTLIENTKMEVSLENLPSGNYIINITAEDGVLNKKVFIK